ncbi:N-methyl-L-tryptophan oxidase [Rathayibacter sp. VKM Ac-2754]|uniref:N-methyl-L-tryptophan oxidase n=1 Tax=Rathayibacter sp. VKM Ac-2754 TaxID=2609251 RepID=UPI001356D82B|nr:N-methyl-L-tryptophan oxidase [Rathayibacter sp. VKM Ac-2754]MWV58549.1 N-methyl-L-tryptophan oxidase [Rathayibacter sp. VKM Ac-2754]
MEHVDVAVVGLGAIGSAAAYHLARRGARVVAFEQFELGHVRGASHDTSRIIRTSYGAPEYVRLAQAAYRDWAEFEAVSGETLVSVTGGVVFFPPGSPYSAEAFRASLTETGVPFELLTPAEVAARWPQFVLPAATQTVYTADSGIVHASRSVAALQMQARQHGAELRDRTPVERLTPVDDGVVVHTARGDVHAGKVIVAADAWTNALLAPLGAEIPLVAMQEQVSYFGPSDPGAFDRERFPVWIWEDEHCFYGFPTYGEPTIKAARDVSDNLMSPDERTFAPSPGLLDELRAFLAAVVPASGEVLRTLTCQYALTPDRRFILGPLDEHPDILVGLGAGHAFKFTPTLGRVLAELALDGTTTEDVSAFGVAPPVAAPVLG